MNKFVNLLSSGDKLKKDDKLKADIASITYMNKNERPKKWEGFNLDVELSDKHCAIYTKLPQIIQVKLSTLS